MTGMSGEGVESSSDLGSESGEPLPDMEESSQPNAKTNTDTMIMYFIVPI